MIYEMRHMPPYINFSNGNTAFTGKQGETATVWLNTLYNQAAYDFTLLATGARVVKISDYEYQVLYTEKGSYKIKLTVQGKEKPAIPEVPIDPKQDTDTQPKGTESPITYAQTPTIAAQTPIVLQSNILEVIIT